MNQEKGLGKKSNEAILKTSKKDCRWGGYSVLHSRNVKNICNTESKLKKGSVSPLVKMAVEVMARPIWTANLVARAIFSTVSSVFEGKEPDSWFRRSVEIILSGFEASVESTSKQIIEEGNSFTGRICSDDC